MRRLLLVGFVSLALVAPAQAADSQPCKTWGPCAKTLRLDGEVTKWRSPETFRASRGALAVEVNLRVDGRRALLDWQGCRGTYAGRRVTLHANTCGRSTRLRVRAVSFAGRTRAWIAYRALYR